jgi:hypothetical protein
MRSSALWLFGFTCNAITDVGFALYSVPRRSLSLSAMRHSLKLLFVKAALVIANVIDADYQILH